MMRRRLIPLAVVLALLAGVAYRPRPGRTEAAEAERQQLWTCGMHPQVIQDRPGVCPICGMQLVPLEGRGSTAAEPAERKPRYWWDPMMDPPYISDRPGKSPMGMDLVPVYDDQISAGPAVLIDPAVVQNMGVRVATVAEGPLRTTVRAVGVLEEAQPNQHDVTVRVAGFVRRLHADTEGMHVAAGDPLFELYSPELEVAVGELIAARRLRGRDGAGDALYRTIVRKLRLWDVDATEIERLAQLDRAPETVTFRSPWSGHVTMKPIVQGSAVQAGQQVLRIVDHSALWCDLQVFERDLPLVRVGQKATATLAALPGRRFDGEVRFVHPHVDMTTRTALVRLVLPNPGLELRPGMYARAELTADVAPRALLVPREAVIDTGTRQIVFVVRDAGHFEPRLVTTGLAADDGRVQVLTGLAPGETVVTSGQFLLDAESRLREAIQKHLEERRLKPAVPPAAGHGHAP